MFKKYLLILCLIAFIVPSVTFASWYSPFSWFSRKQVERPTVSNPVPSPVVEIPKPVENIVTPPTVPVKIIPTKKEVKIKNNITPPLAKDKATVIKESAPTVIDPSNNSVPLHYTDPIPAPIVNAPKSALIAEFLTNPTLDNFKSFCISAKSVTGNSTKQVLDSTRENMVTVKLSVYDDMKDCKNLDNKDSQISYLTLDDNLLLKLENSDTDEIRTAKLTFNEKVRNLKTTSKVNFIGFIDGCYKDKKTTRCSPTELFQIYIEKLNVNQTSLDKAQSLVNDQNLVDNSNKSMQNNIRNLNSATNQLKDTIRDLASMGGRISDLSSHFK